MPAFNDQLQGLLADRRSPEARAFYLSVFGYVQRRVGHICGTRYSDLITVMEREELVADVGMKLMTGALARFRGDSLPELLAYVRVITDRSVSRLVRQRIRERAGLNEGGSEAAQDLVAEIPHPEQSVEIEVTCPLPQKDQDYLVDLLNAGSKAEYARQHGQSRAAVTRMVQRIQERIAALTRFEQVEVDVWMKQQARVVLDGPLPM